VHIGKLDVAQAEAEQLLALQSKMLTANEQLFARNIQVLSLELGSWIAQARGQAGASVALMNQAAALEVATPKHPVTPGPTIPAYEQLGDLLTELKQPAEALAAYERSLELYPHRFNSLVGAARAAHASGDATLARSRYAELIKVADGSGRESIMREARQYAARLK
jgi:tetratricopeptide (TPR) repeat protein